MVSWENGQVGQVGLELDPSDLNNKFMFWIEQKKIKKNGIFNTLLILDAGFIIHTDIQTSRRPRRAWNEEQLVNSRVLTVTNDGGKGREYTLDSSPTCCTPNKACGRTNH